MVALGVGASVGVGVMASAGVSGESGSASRVSVGDGLRDIVGVVVGVEVSGTVAVSVGAGTVSYTHLTLPTTPYV